MESKNKMMEHVYTLSSVSNEGTEYYSKHLTAVFADKQAAIETMESCIRSEREWITKMEVPIGIYLNNVNEFERTLPQGDFLGFSQKKWKKAIKRFRSNNHSECRVMVEKRPLKCTLRHEIETLYNRYFEIYKPVDNDNITEYIYTLSCVYNEGTIDYTKSLVDIFSDVDTAIAACESYMKRKGEWVNEMEVPIEIYLKNVDEFERTSPQGKFLGYLKVKWDKTIKKFKENNFSYRIMIEKRPLYDRKSDYIKTIYERYIESYNPLKA